MCEGPVCEKICKKEHRCFSSGLKWVVTHRLAWNAKKKKKTSESTYASGTEQIVPLQKNKCRSIYIGLKCFFGVLLSRLQRCLLSKVTAMHIIPVFTRHGLSVAAICNNRSQFSSPSWSNLKYSVGLSLVASSTSVSGKWCQNTLEEKSAKSVLDL